MTTSCQRFVEFQSMRMGTRYIFKSKYGCDFFKKREVVSTVIEVSTPQYELTHDKFKTRI